VHVRRGVRRAQRCPLNRFSRTISETHPIAAPTSTSRAMSDASSMGEVYPAQSRTAGPTRCHHVAARRTSSETRPGIGEAVLSS